MYAALLLALAAVDQTPASPADACLVAAADLATIERQDRQYTFYMRLDAVGAEAQAKLATVAIGWLQATSRSPAITIPDAVVGPNGTAILRVRWDAYHYSKLTIDKLADQDSTYHTDLVEQWPGGFDARFGREFKAGRYKIRAFAPWIAETPQQYQAISYLAHETQVRTPIIDASNFIWQTAIQNERKVGYYGILGIRNRKDFLKLGGAHEEDLAIRPETLAVVSTSKISQEPRRIARFPSDGGTWITFDNAKAVGDKNPLTFIDKGFKADAQEAFTKLPNDFWLVGLFKGNADPKTDGDTQESAPDFIGYHHQTRSNDGRIHVGFTCFSCHDAQAGNGGLQPIDDFVRAAQANPKVRLYPKLQADIDALRDKYGPNIQRRLDDDRAGYARALKEATGMTPDKFARSLADVFEEADGAVDLVVAARRMGTTPTRLKDAIDAYSVDPRSREYQVLQLAGLASGQKLTVNSWNEVINLANLELRGLIQWSPEHKVRALKP